MRLEANPKPNVTWTLGGKDIVDGIRYMTTVVQEWEVNNSQICAQKDLINIHICG